jgi:hypothetical protein
MYFLFSFYKILKFELLLLVTAVQDNIIVPDNLDCGECNCCAGLPWCVPLSDLFCSKSNGILRELSFFDGYFLSHAV